MSAAKYIFISLILSIFDQTLLLIQLPAVEDNDIVKCEALIRFTTNKLFSILELRTVHTTLEMKQYSQVHNYLTSQTLQDYNSLKEIAKLTRVDKSKIENITTDFIALLNEILDEENVLELQNVIKTNVVKNDYDIVDEVQKLELLRTYYLGPYTGINTNILKVLEGTASLSSNQNVSSMAEETFPELDTKTVINNNILLTLIDIDTHDDNETKFTVNDNDHNDTEGEIDPYWHESDIPISGRRIFKGTRAKSKYFPFMASIQIFKKFQCGGTIISKDLIVTAASCLQLAYNNRLYRENPTFLSVRIGTQFFESGGDHIPVLEIYFYPGYDPQNLRHNLAVLRLSRWIKFGKRAKKIEIDKEAAPMPMNTDGIMILGWGALTLANSINSPFVNKLRFAILDVYPLADCQAIYSNEYVTEQNFCAGFITDGTGACNRDIGGPGVALGVLKGIISFGAPVCGTPDAPTVFTKVGYYYNWIEEIMEQEVPSKKQRTTKKLNMTLVVIKKKPKPTTPTPWTISPLYHEIAPLTVPIHTNDSPNDLRYLDKSLFKDFLKTMFNSLEIEEYLDMMKETPIPVSKSVTGSGKRKVTKKGMLLSRQVKTSESSTSSIKQLSPLGQELVNPNIIKVTRMDVAEPTLGSDSSSESDEFMKNFTIISVANATKGPRMTKSLTNIESQLKIESQANIEANIDNQANTESQANIEGNIENQANIESQADIESDANIESQEKIESQAFIENQADIESLINTDKPPEYARNSTKLEMFDLLEDNDAYNDEDLEERLLKLVGDKDSTTESPLTLFSLPQEPVSTTPLDNKNIDEAILTLLYLSDNETGNINGLSEILSNNNKAPLNVNQGEESDNGEKIKNESVKPNSSKAVLPVNPKLDYFKDFTYRGNNKSLQDFLSKNIDMLGILQEALIASNKSTNGNLQQRVTKL